MALDHIVARFHLARWASAEGRVEILDRSTRIVTLEDPTEFNRVEGFNAMVRPDGSEDRWLETEFLAGLDSDAARYLTQLEQVQPPSSHLRRLRREDWHLNHLLAPRHNVRLAMFVAAQAVRSPIWREAVKLNTATDMKRTVEAKVERELAEATDPVEIERLNKLLGLRYLVTETPTNMVPHLSGHLTYRLGQILYESYTWAVHRFEEPLLLIGDEPVVLFSHTDRRQIGSFSQVATAKDAALSIYAPLEELVEKAIEVIAASDRILMPIGPRHALVLSRFEHLWPAGRYDGKPPLAAIFNTLVAISSTRWVGCLPGSEPPTVVDRGRRRERPGTDASVTKP